MVKIIIKRSGKSGRTGTMGVFKVSITRNLVFPSADAAKSIKSRIQRKVPTATFSGIMKTGRGYRMSVRTTYVKKLPSALSAASVSAHLKRRSPGCKVSVVKV